MSSAFLIAMMVFLGFAQVNDANRYETQAADPVIPDATIRVADDIKLSAEEPGVLVHLAIDEGSLIRAGDKIGQIDDREPQMQKKAAQSGYAAAYKAWKDEVEIQFSQAAAAVAKADYEQLEETNKLAEKAVPAVDIRRAKLEWDKMNWSIKKAIHDQQLAEYEARTKMTELQAAELAIQRRVITAPFDGMVEKLYRKQNEWVNPGDPILYLLRLDTMEVEGAVDPGQYDPHELQACEVTVEVQLARGRKETVRGRITKVSSLVREDGVYEVRAEVPNRQEHGTWVLRDGHLATMTIHLGTGGTAAAGVSRAQ